MSLGESLGANIGAGAGTSLAPWQGMFGKKKSGFDKVLDALELATGLMGASNGKRRKKGNDSLQRSLRLAAYVAPVLWANRSKIRGAADTALKSAQQRLEASKQALIGHAPESAGANPQGQQQGQNQAA